MKAENLKILRDNGFPVPPFTVVTGSEVDLSFSRAETFAVRSTFEGEDTGDSSFAGQFDTLLDVPRAEVASAVEQVRKSYEKETIRAYREALLRKSGEAPSVVPADHASRTAPVLVQEMLHPDMAGVAFSSNPTGLLNEIVLVVGEGLGDAVVEDRADTTTYYYNKDDALYYYETQGDSPTLETGVLETLWDLVQRVEELYGRPMDIEYAVCGTDVYLLQARPITTFRGKDLIVLDSSNIVESYPDLTLPLSMSFAKEIYYEIFRALLIRATNGSTVVSELDPSLRDMVAMANGRVYYRITSWYDILRLMPFSDRFIAIWQEMLGVSNKAVDSDLKVPVRTKAVMLKTILNYLRITPREMDRLSEFYETYANDLDEELARLARAEGQEKVRGLLRKYHGLKNDVIPRWDITLMNDMYAFLFTALSGKKNREQLSNLSNLASMEPAKAMNALAETARAKGMDSDEYRSQKDRFLSDYGDRCLGELKLETRTYRTNPELVDLYVERLSEPANTPSAAPSQNAVPSRTLNPFVRRARVGIRNREISRLNRTRLYGFARTIFTEIGNALYDMDLLDDPLDVFYLYIPELETYASWDRKEGADFRRRVDERKKQYEQFAELPPYTRLVYDGQIHQKQTHGLQTDRPAAPGLMTGTGVSHGTAVGEAFVVEQPDLSMDTTGKILVTHSTDPGWVFLIQNAAGIVAEKGSLLSHTAIITRELGKPAVVGVKDATRLIQTGDTVVVDADAGTVRLSESAERGGAR
ncbi:MAG: PEP/pyruvate-binding domain-containing protein [Eubacteriales bacterium]|nr:PEP/pyruvate-binding domain-containing protein [Eubacteriales bacterium]